MKTKRIAFIASAALLLVMGVLSLRGRFEAKPVLAQASQDVLIFTCISMPVTFLHEGSSGAPAVTATTCSQGLADALNAGFRIQSSNAIGGPSVGSIYTMVRDGGFSGGFSRGD
jgi:hypothetical protein